MTDRHHLLPPNATPLERAASSAMGPWTVGDAALSTLQDPARIPAHLLPHMGLAEDVPVWPQAEAERRAVIKASPRLHALIGTPRGLRELARLGGARIERLEMPPAKTFLGYWDAESRAQWLAAHPEMRIYSQRERAPCEGLMLGSGFVGAQAEPPARTSAMARSAIRAEIRYPTGQVLPLTTHGWTDMAQDRTATVDLARRAVARGQHLGQPLAGVMSRADASTRYWRVQTVNYRERLQLLTLKQTAPSLAPLSPDAEPVAERAARPNVLCAGLPLGGFTVRSDSARRMYARIRLHDPAVANVPKHGPAYLGFTRLSSPPFVALAHVRMPARRQPFAMAGTAMRAALSVGDARERMAPALDAMDWARAAHDKVLIRTRLHATARASRIHRAGAVLAGQTINRS
ncbi:phage tail protein [Acidovorax sp. ACV02]|uniref:phage tail protein n=1 Tax=Acidovorax sp. ACV02 TaxID=2769310 RepID=UPI0017831069|nr:phage tail protein [Acidovorax sp. ACV02]MBD9407254.1 phage tail protein [Acidovorax sp. ACV02]